MNVTLVNRSTWSTESLQSILTFVEGCFADVRMPVRLTIKSKRGAGTWGKAYWPVRHERRRAIKPGEYAVVLYIGTFDRNYPFSREYKKRAGAYVAHSLVDEIVHTLAHELRHVEQFEACQVYRDAKGRDPYLTFGAFFRRYEKNWAGFQSNSCEVDAERIAHAILAGYRHALEAFGSIDQANRRAA